eukprot:GABV01001373.1.p1 GENE.GABV01001373.1~~GABV01001373.1.p1  ORF type:complete len:158 (+),score=31.18 GABV01001373.1:400-873(+)
MGEHLRNEDKSRVGLRGTHKRWGEFGVAAYDFELNSQADPLHNLTVGVWGVGNLSPSLTMAGQIKANTQGMCTDWRASVLARSGEVEDEAQRNFELGFHVRDRGQTAALTYFHHLVTRRGVYNPLEAKQVVGILNFIDIGFVNFSTHWRWTQEYASR